MSERDTLRDRKPYREDRDPDSNPDTTVLGPKPPDFDRDDTRSRHQRDAAIQAIRDTLSEERGARGVWRIVGALAATIAIGLGSAALALAMTASADHERVNRHDEVIESLREDVTAIRVDVSAVRARVENRRSGTGE